MQAVSNITPRDPRYMDDAGQFWFYNVAFDASYGPYRTPVEAGAALASYTEWVNTQAQATVAKPSVSSEVEQAVAEFVRMRDERDALSVKQKEQLALLDDTLARGEAYLMGQLQAMGVDSFKVGAGTVFTSTLARSSIPDKGAFSQFVLETGQVDLLQMRLANVNLEKWIGENDGNLPPGVSFSRERVVRVRRN